MNRNSIIFIQENAIANVWQIGGHFVQGGGGGGGWVNLRNTPQNEYAFNQLGGICTVTLQSKMNSFPPRQNERQYADDSFKCIFMNEKFCISIQISLKVVPNGLINNELALVQVMAWRRTGDKPLTELLLTQFTEAYMRH